MSVSRRRRLRSSRAAGRLVLGAILGELFGAVVGLVVAPSRHVGATVQITEPCYDNTSNTSDSEESDPRVAWPLLGAIAGVVVGVGAVRVYEELRQVCSRGVKTRRQSLPAVTGQ
jgi:hypothetical protein